MKPQSNLLQPTLWLGVLWMVYLVFPGLAQRSVSAPNDCPGSKRAEAIPWSQLGARAGENYRGDGLAVSTTATGISAAQRAVKEAEARLSGKPLPKTAAIAG